MYYYVEIIHSFFVVINHLISFGSLVHKTDVCRDFFDATAEWENRFFKLFHTAVGQA